MVRVRSNSDCKKKIMIKNEIEKQKTKTFQLFHKLPLMQN